MKYKLKYTVNLIILGIVVLITMLFILKFFVVHYNIENSNISLVLDTISIDEQKDTCYLSNDTVNSPNLTKDRSIRI